MGGATCQKSCDILEARSNGGGHGELMMLMQLPDFSPSGARAWDLGARPESDLKNYF